MHRKTQRRVGRRRLLPVALAEISALFNRDLDLARRLIDKTAKSTMDSPIPLLLKGEILRGASICLDAATMKTYRSQSGEKKQERYRDLIEHKTLSFAEYRTIRRHAREVGLPVAVSVYDFEGADLSVAENVVGLKITSSNVTQLPLIRPAFGAARRSPSDRQWRASLGEVDRAVRVARKAGCQDLILQHSPDGHPAPASNHKPSHAQVLSRISAQPTGAVLYMSRRT